MTEFDSIRYWVRNLFFKIFFFKILKDMAKNYHRSSIHIQIHDLGHFLGKIMTLLNLYLVLLLEWSIVTGNFTSIHQFLKTCKKSLILWVSPVNSNFVSGLWAILSGQNLLSVKSLCMSLLPTISVCLEEKQRRTANPTRYISKTHSQQQQQLT